MSRIGKVVTLTNLEQEIARLLAGQRFRSAREMGAVATLYGNGNPLKRELGAAGAELAFCRIADVYPDLDGEHPGVYDAWTRGGEWIDVKHSEQKDARLLVKATPDRLTIHRCDWYVLMVGVFPTFTYAGRMHADELLVEARLDRTLTFPAYAARQDELKRTLKLPAMVNPAALLDLPAVGER